MDKPMPNEPNIEEPRSASDAPGEPAVPTNDPSPADDQGPGAPQAGAASAATPQDGADPEEAPIETFLPTDLYRGGAVRASKRKRALIIGGAVLLLVAAVGIGGVTYLNRLKSDPSAFFAEQPQSSPTPGDTLPAEATATPTVDPYAALEAQADTSMMQNIVNIMLIGVDYAEERESWEGKDGLTASHADVMIVLAVNFDKNRADLISLPRDTYTTIPGVSGIYKLNAALDCGGGLKAAGGAGFLKVCESASYLLGDLPINYYYAVTMPAVKQLVDAIGGVDYDVDVEFSMQGRSYQPGMQHMDGQAVLDYLRVRKAGTGLKQNETGDSNRVKRQKRMLVAIFDKLKSDGTMLQIPDILSAFSGQLFTNCTTSQTAALALYGYNMPKDNIGMYSFGGSMRTLYTWNFSFINMANRKKIIKEVYGIDVGSISNITESHAASVYQNKIANQYISTCAGLTSYVQRLIDEDDARVSPTPSASPSPTPEATGTPRPTESVTPEPVTPEPVTPAPATLEPATPVPATATPESAQAPVAQSDQVGGEGVSLHDWYSGGGAPEFVRCASGSFAIPSVFARTGVRAEGEDGRRYSDAQRAVFSSYLSALSNCKALRGGNPDELASACDKLQSAALRCASTFGYTGSFSWGITPLANTNEIYVDFR